MIKLTTEQWDAAHEAARIRLTCSQNREEDRLAYRTAKFKLAMLLPDDLDVSEVINQVASFRVADAMAAVLVGLPAEALA
jgi:acetoacetate decarboxylase